MIEFLATIIGISISVYTMYTIVDDFLITKNNKKHGIR